MQKVLDVLRKAKDFVVDLAQKAPFSTGLALGYLCSALISAAIALVRAALGLL